jgi:hypothetical protein
MWRNCVDGARDFYLVHSKDGRRLSKPMKLGDGTWKINACPMDGGGLAHEGRRTMTVWRREMDLFMAEPGKPESKLGEGKDPAVAASEGRVYVAWVSGGKLELWRDGKTEPLAENGVMPSIAPLPAAGVLAVWEKDGGISVQRIH